MTAYWILRSLEFPWETERERQRERDPLVAILSMLLFVQKDGRNDVWTDYGNGENSENST